MVVDYIDTSADVEDEDDATGMWNDKTAGQDSVLVGTQIVINEVVGDE
ncbi:hypothetical protein ES702_03071 [subsurface metagenome]